MKKKGFIIGGICLAAIVGILGYNHDLSYSPCKMLSMV